jgi:hypothetical protein
MEAMKREKRRGFIGRPPTLIDPVKLAIWFERASLERAKQAAHRKGMTISEVLRGAIERLAREMRR